MHERELISDGLVEPGFRACQGLVRQSSQFGEFSMTGSDWSGCATLGVGRLSAACAPRAENLNLRPLAAGSKPARGSAVVRRTAS